MKCSKNTVKMSILHTFHDGSLLKCISVRELLAIPIWKGNRILDMEHAAKLKGSVGSNVQSLDSGYKIVKYNEETTGGELVEQSYIIDGQHRSYVLREILDEMLCPPNFPVIVTERKVETELEAIEYFNQLNTVKPQSWDADPNLIINLYIAALERKFNVNKKRLIRQGVAHRPFLSTDKLRAKLQKIKGLKFGATDIQNFVERVVAHNLIMKTQYQVKMALDKCDDEKFIQKADTLEFYLALDPKLKWIDELLAV